MTFEFTDQERLHIAGKLLGNAKRKLRDAEDAREKNRHPQLVENLKADAVESQRLAAVLSGGTK